MGNAGVVLLTYLRSSRGIVTIGALVLVAMLFVSERAYAQKEFLIVGTVDCGLPSGRRCTIDDVLRLWTSDVTGERARFTVDVSWVKNQLAGYDQDDAVCVEVRAMPDGTLQAIGISATCGAPPPTRRPTQEPRDGRQPEIVPSPTSTPKPNAPTEPLADLSIAKEGELECGEGCYIDWTITITNHGPDVATNVVVGEFYDHEDMFCYVLEGTPYNFDTDQWTVGTLGVGESQTLEFSCDLFFQREPDGFENTVEVVSVDQRDPDSTPNNGNPEEDDRATDFQPLPR